MVAAYQRLVEVAVMGILAAGRRAPHAIGRGPEGSRTIRPRIGLEELLAYAARNQQ